MNFLAHMYLSCNDSDLLVGNFIADFIRNRDLVLYSEEVQRGVTLHRHIDHFTDSHPIVIESTRLLRENHGKYAPVVIDVCYDFVLSKNWDRYSGEDLQSFSDTVYAIIEERREDLPDSLQDMSRRMINDNFLMKYGTESGLKKTFDRISKRAKYKGSWDTAYDDFMDNYTQIEDGFNRFFPEMIESIEAYCTC